MANSDTLKCNPEFYWDNVLFKVEDELFSVPRCGFVRSSEVFADMFLLPSGPGARTEGQEREHPIVLEGYKKDEFACLLRVMYPTAESLISGTKIDLCLKKEEWVSVLKLSVIWNMKKTRDYAIHRLSSDVILSPVEKILLARAHKVAIWLEEGVTSLVNDQNQSFEDLAKLGWETAARIIWISKKSSPVVTVNSPNTPSPKQNGIKYMPHTASSQFANGFGPGSNHCVPAAIAVNFNFGGPVLATSTPGITGSPVTIKAGSKPKEMIKEMFGEEIKNYELAMLV